MVSNSEILPYLRKAIELAHSFGRSVKIKNFPSCMLGKYAYTVVNAQPKLFIDPDFWDEFSKNDFFQCDHRAQCEDKECLGLNGAYVKKYGKESHLLNPI